MIEALSPGVYVSFEDQSLYAAANVPVIGLMLGASHKGSLDPVFITNSEEFIQEFGVPTGDSYLHYNALSYLKRGRFLWVQRIASSAAAYGETDLLDGSDAATVKVKTRTKEDDLNGYKVYVEQDTSLDLLQKKSSVSTLEFVGVVTQPVNITGVTLANPTGQTVSGVTLALTITGVTPAYSLTWGGGTPVDVTAGGSFTLTNSGATSTVTAIVTVADLPATDQTDTGLAVTATIPAGAVPALPGIIFSNPSGGLGQHTITYTYTSDTNITLKFDAGSASASIHNQTSLSIGHTTGSVTANIVRYGFKILFKDPDNTLLETLDKLSKDPESPNFHETRVASLSRYLITDDYDANYTLPVANTEAYLIAGGNAGMSGITDADYIGTYTAESKTGLLGFSNDEEYTIDFVNIPGQVSSPIVSALLDFCNTRQDCTALIDSPAGLTYQEVVQWTNGEGAYSDRAAFNNMWGQVFHDWLNYYDPYTEDYIYLPPTCAYLDLLANAYVTGKEFQAIAGYNRGQVSGALGLASSPNQSQRDYMLSDALGNSVNPFVNFTRDGIILFGEKTLQRRLSSTNRAHAVRTLAYLFRQVKSIAKNSLFEPHDATTWRTLSANIEPILDYLKSPAKRALYDARFVCDKSTNPDSLIDQNIVGAKLFVKFMKNAEMITINIVATSTGADFSLL